MIVHVRNFETCNWCEYLTVSNCFMFQKVRKIWFVVIHIYVYLFPCQTG